VAIKTLDELDRDIEFLRGDLKRAQEKEEKIYKALLAGEKMSESYAEADKRVLKLQADLRKLIARRQRRKR